MSLGQYAVVVEPSRFSGANEELAERLAPVLRVPARSVVEMLQRGRITVDADLDAPAAERISKRLASLGIPAQILDENGLTGPSAQGVRPTPAPPSPSQRPTPMVAVEEPSVSAGANDIVETDLANLLDALEGLDDVVADSFNRAGAEGAVADDPIESHRTPVADDVEDRDGRSQRSEAPETDGWGSVLPSIGAATEPDEPRAPRLTSPSRRRPTDNGEVAVDDRSLSLLAEFEETARRTEETGRPMQGVEGPGGEPPKPRRPASPPPPQMPSAGPKNSTARRPESSQARRAAQNGKKTPSSESLSGGDTRSKRVEPTDAERHQIQSDRAFDASAMTAALVPRSHEDQPPYKPKGFNPDPPHMAKVAAALSAIAPGAGQVFNGDDEEALDYGLKFFLIKPWVDSVKDARRRGEKIATYWLPPPEPGSALRALRYLVFWWAAVIGIVAMLVALGNWGWDYMHREPIVEITEAEITAATEDAVTNVRLARIEALRALADAQLSVPDRRFTMTPEERADRLFIIGYRHCQNRNYGSCERIMRRVTSLKKSDPRAFRLQAWASAAQSGDVGPFPAVEGVPTLSDFETEELSLELGVQAPRDAREKSGAIETGADAGAELAPDAGGGAQTSDGGTMNQPQTEN